MREGGWVDQGITPGGLKKLRAAFIDCGDVEKLKLPGLRDDRAPVLPGGLAIMSAILTELEIDLLEVSDGALRQGIPRPAIVSTFKKLLEQAIKKIEAS